MTRCENVIGRAHRLAAHPAVLSRRTGLSRRAGWRTVASRIVAVLAAALALPFGAVEAQPAPGHRVFPAQALRGELIVTTVPEVVLNGRTDRLAPGARLRGEDNLLVMGVAVSGQRLVVHYTREATTGLLLDVWILNAIERQNRPWPTTTAEAAAWRFDPVGQTWTRP